MVANQTNKSLLVGESNPCMTITINRKQMTAIVQKKEKQIKTHKRLKAIMIVGYAKNVHIVLSRPK